MRPACLLSLYFVQVFLWLWTAYGGGQFAADAFSLTSSTIHQHPAVGGSLKERRRGSPDPAGITSSCTGAQPSRLLSRTKTHRWSYPAAGDGIRLASSVTSEDAYAAGSSSEDSSTAIPSLDDFDYTAHWYPATWIHDLRLNDPTRVTVFDVDYVVAKTSSEQVICMIDKCPHKAAALSQGRVTAGGLFQCAYHGWSFDGKTGECVEIPQLVEGDDDPFSLRYPKSSCGTAIPAQVHQEMVWIFPGSSDETRLQEALLAPPPPTVPELESSEGFRQTTSIRDMPVDWPIVISNICDADHGLFAHQALPFDLYSGSKEHPLNVASLSLNMGKGYQLNSSVPAVEKVLTVNRTRRAETTKVQSKQDDPPLTATQQLTLPHHLQLRRVKKNGSTDFVSTFYICPVGVGRCRFMAAGVSRKPPPRWLTKLFLDNFLDQDTYLLATQQQHILGREAKEIRGLVDIHGREAVKKMTMSTRKRLFCLAAPSEQMGSKIEAFWDATLTRVPNRVETLLKLDSSGAFLSTPERSKVLDRAKQHLAIAPWSQDVVRRCQLLQKVGKRAALTLVITKGLALSLRQTLPLCSKWNAMLKPIKTLVAVALFRVTATIANAIEKEYYFKYTDDLRRKDLAKIPKQVWKDHL